MKARIAAICWLVVLCTMNGLCADWARTDGPYGGLVWSLVAKPQELGGSSLFAGTSGGVFRSTDNGSQWTPVNAGLTNTYVASLTLSGANLFVGTNGGGVFLSSNDGAGWTAVNTGLTETMISALAALGTHLYAGTPSGVFLTTDNGTTWSKASSGSPECGVWDFTHSGTYLFAGTAGCGIFRSSDSGASWSGVNVGIPLGVPVYALLSLGPDLFAGTSAGVYRSTNEGTSWSLLSDLRTLELEAVGTTIFAGTEGGVFRSTTNGISWGEANTGIPSAGVWSFASADTDLFAGTTVGVYRSSNCGEGWTAVSNGLPYTGEIHAIAVGPTGAGGTNIVAGTLGHGVFRSTDNGATWSPRGLSGAAVYALAFTDTFLFAGTSGGVFRSTDDGATWTSTGQYRYTTAFAARPRDPSGTDLFTGCIFGDGVYRSSDNGLSWSYAGLVGEWVTSLAVSSDGTTLIAGIYPWNSVGIYRSTDDGVSWTQTHDRGVTSALAVNGTDFLAGTAYGVYRSTDNGLTWASLDTNVETYVVSLAVGSDAGGSPVVFAGMWDQSDLTGEVTGQGVFLFQSNGSGWTGANVGLPRTNVYALTVSRDLSGVPYLVAGTNTGIWRRPLSEMITSVPTTAREEPAGFSLDQNFPNPFNPNTLITYSLEKSFDISLNVYDALGRRAASLADGIHGPGSYAVQWEAGHLASGVYFIELRIPGGAKRVCALLLK